jgi:transposase
MSLKSQPVESVPQQTQLVAKAAFPKGNLYIKMREELGTIFQDQDFEKLYPKRGKPGFEPWRLALVTIMQFAENLSDRQAADAVRARIDWKYALSLELEDPGFDFSVLSEFRARLIAGESESLLLDKMLDIFSQKQLIKVRGRQRTDSTHVLAAIRVMNRLEVITETMRATLNDLATVAPEWLSSVVPAEWYQRYGQRAEQTRLPSGEKARNEYAQVVGQDGVMLLKLLEQQPDLQKLESVKTLQQMWERHFARSEMAELIWLKDAELARAATAIESPYDTQARHSSKRDIVWTGYKVHLTETCDPELPRLVTHVHTTVATTQDVSCTADIQQGLAAKGLLPSRHLVDCGYVDADLLVSSQEKYQIELFGPARYNPSWQAREGGYDLYQFQVDWEKQVVKCPEGKQTIWWGQEKVDPGIVPRIRTRFSQKDCAPCSSRSKCVRSDAGRARVLVLQNRVQYEALRHTRAEMTSEAGRKEYHKRAGIEGSLSEGIRRCGLRRSRYRGLAKTHLQHVASAAAMDVVRVMNHLQGRPLAPTRVSRFARLAT